MPSYEMSPFSLRFKDAETEQEYRRDFDVKNRSFYLVGIGFSIIGWLSIVVDAQVYQPARTGEVALFVGTLLMPLLLFIAAIVWARRLVAWHQPICAVANLLAGLLITYLGLVVLRAALISIAYLICIAFFAFFVLRIRLVMATLICTAYLLVFLVGAASGDVVAPKDVTMLLSGVPTILAICVVGGYALERSARQIFAQERTIEAQKAVIEAEHRRSERLLLNILPPEIAARLKHKEEIIADSYPEASVLFCDIVGFTPLSAELTPEELVALLNELFSIFDGLVEKYELEKIKTIGDAYMVVAGVPQQSAEHAARIMALAVDMLLEIEAHNAAAQRATRIRIGISSGPVVAGVIGRKKFLFDLWGDTVNTASRMESSGLPGAIHVAPETRALLAGRYEFESRGPIEIKGKGTMETWLYRP